MIKTVPLTAERRSDKGKGPARQMRMKGRIPAVIYGRGRKAESLSVSSMDVGLLFKGGVTTSTVIELAVDGKSANVLIRAIQRHPVRHDVQHLDFYAIRADETITVDVAIHLDGTPSGVRNAGATLDQVLREVTIAVLPRNIPERVSLDVTDLEIAQSLHVHDLVIENAKVLTDTDKTICTVIAPRVEEVEAPAEVEIEEEVEGAEPELIRKPKADDETGESTDAEE